MNINTGIKTENGFESDYARQCKNTMSQRCINIKEPIFPQQVNFPCSVQMLLQAW